eukprot:gnl/TRDRNA2_/TRDRNA2_154405_c2_seq2.p1 gnl/TRDRNA2_/TRDRNA2_154405_c2~~gnl/TRDRNA2_/TRDRNA2_154405_c2_seq2.p1  ORF type:complete len:882 (-),score=150.15 gnl/TRDRNA2_/TRDRNA2_154405_c2_seq2:122-2545(-)
MLGTDPLLPLPDSAFLGIASLAEMCNHVFRKAWPNCNMSPATAQGLAEGLEAGAALLRSGQAALGPENLPTIRSLLLKLESVDRSFSNDSEVVVRVFEVALLLSIAAMQGGIARGHSGLVRQAAQHVTALSLDVAGRLEHASIENSENNENDPAASNACSWRLPVPATLLRRMRHAAAPVVRCRSRSRSPQQRRKLKNSFRRCSSLGKTRIMDVAFEICSAAVPMCSGTTVFFLHELRRSQRTSEEVAAAEGVPEWLGGGSSSGASALSRFCNGMWLSEIPSSVSVAWIQLDREAQVLQISRLRDGRRAQMPTVQMFSHRVALSAGTFSKLEEEFRLLQEEHHRAVQEHMKKPDCNSREMRQVFWDDRSRFDSKIRMLAQTLQDQVIREWAFLFSVRPTDDEEACSLRSSFREWALSTETYLSSHSADDGGLTMDAEPMPTHVWLLELLYMDVDLMRTDAVSAVLSQVLPASTSSSDSWNAGSLLRLAASMQDHRRRARQSVAADSAGSLLLFVDSALAQLPLEACPSLWNRKVVRAVAPNVALSAFARLAAECGDSSLQNAAVAPQPLSRQPRSGYYILDPFGDAGFAGGGLQKLLGGWRATRARGLWEGHVGQRACPPAEKILGMLGSQDVFVYMGHGDGALRLLRGDKVQLGAAKAAAGGEKGSTRLTPLQAVVLLMGCSSAKLVRPADLAGREEGRGAGSVSAAADVPRPPPGMEFESFGMPLNLLIGGSPATLGTLWNILGGDLDILSCAFLNRWVHTTGGADCGTSNQNQMSMMDSLLSARQCCRLKYLTGASVVCYGVPM